MRTVDSIKPDAQVTVTITGPDGTRLYENTGTGYHSLETAINDAISHARMDVSPEDCVFEVSNAKSGVSHRYRINAHGNLKLIV